MAKQQTAPFAHRLLDWFDQHGRKDLPWQHPRDPYRVWISEIMLQQTQVGTVIPYFEKWMQQFPDTEALAKAELDEVLSLWAGLGYYARARNLHKAARICQQEFDGELPLGVEDLCNLPGIGLSTANAIISQSTGKPAAVLDGNVRRVLARHTRLEEWPGSASAQRSLWQVAEQRLPASRGDDYTQAIMDLGAMVCVRSKPRCAECPVSEDCQALADGLVDQLPLPKPKTKVSQRQLYWLAIMDPESRILLQKRPPAGIWGGLWCLPEAGSLAELEQDSGLDLSGVELLPPRKHRLSHIAMSIHPVLLSSTDAKQVTSQVRFAAEQDWFVLEPECLPGMPRPLTDLIASLRDTPIGQNRPGEN